MNARFFDKRTTDFRSNETFRSIVEMTQKSTGRAHPVVALMTDFGVGDGDVGVMKGVIATITPEAQLIDITHAVAAQHVASGAWILAAAYRYFPKGTVFVCVVDPGVGSTRSAIALQAGDWFFVGPDNGLFSYVLAEQTVQGAVALSNSAYHLPQVSSTFHGRDIFAPVGAHLAGGLSLDALGEALEPASLVRLSVSAPQREHGRIEAELVHVDNFGNLITSIPLTLVPDLYSASNVQITFPENGAQVTQRRRFFAEGEDDQQPFIYADSSGYVAMGVRNGSAARTLQVKNGATITFVTSEG